MTIRDLIKELNVYEKIDENFRVKVAEDGKDDFLYPVGISGYGLDGDIPFVILRVYNANYYLYNDKT